VYELFYIIIGLVLLILFAIFGGLEGIGCFFFLLIGLILWRIGLLGFVISTIIKVARWIIVRIFIYYQKYFGTEEGAFYLSRELIRYII